MVFLFSTAISFSQNCPSKEFCNFFYYSGFSYGGFFDKIQNTGYLLGNIGNYRSSVIKTDINGTLLWAKGYNFSEATSYSEKSNGKVDNTGNYVIDVNAQAIALLNPSGDVLQMKDLKLPFDHVGILGIEVLADNKKIVFAKRSEERRVGKECRP